MTQARTLPICYIFPWIGHVKFLERKTLRTTVSHLPDRYMPLLRISPLGMTYLHGRLGREYRIVKGGKKLFRTYFLYRTTRRWDFLAISMVRDDVWSNHRSGYDGLHMNA